jgi:hypothetical protein
MTLLCSFPARIAFGTPVFWARGTLMPSRRIF